MSLRSAARYKVTNQDDFEEGYRYMKDEEYKDYERKNTNLFRTAVAELAPLQWKHLLLVVFILFTFKWFVRYEMESLPSVVDPKSLGITPGNEDQAILDTDQFVVARARRTLDELTKFGVRLSGTFATEDMAVPWFLKELDNLRQQLGKSSPYELQFSVDHVSGFFDLGFLSGFTSVYGNVSNVLARLDPKNGDTKNALLINSHYDTHFEVCKLVQYWWVLIFLLFFQTVGASDDAVNCAIMLEILRALMSSKTALPHSVIFLFNGAEENILQASNGFLAGISKDAGNSEEPGHPWSKHVRAFVNLEAAGSGGKEALFQTGPGRATPILVRAYAEAAKYPFASVVGQEMFQLGVIPSDTDFRIFRDFGHLPGVDFAFYTNGYVYHTRYDTPERIPDGTIQRAGENLLAVIKSIASLNLSEMPRVENPHDRSGEKLVFFDVFSKFLVVFPFWTVGLFFNITAVTLCIWRIMKLLLR